MTDSYQVMTCIHYSEHVPPYRDGISWSTPILPSPDPASQLVEFAIDVASLKAQSKEVFESGRVTPIDLGLLLVSADHLDRALKAWHEALPSGWESHVVTIASNGLSGETSKKVWKGRIQLYRSIWFGTHCIMLYVLRIHVNAVMLRCLRAKSPSLGSERRCLERLQGLADSICACIAPGIEDIMTDETLPPGFNAKTSGGGAIVSVEWSQSIYWER